MSLMGTDLQKVDHAALRTNQAVIIGLNTAAFVLDLTWLAVVVSTAMLLGTMVKRPGFGWVYRGLLKPPGWVSPDVIMDNPEPHRFAQGFGGVVMAAAVGILYMGASTLGWGLVWLVAALAALNLFGGFCVGCAMYYWLGRLQVPGFSKAPREGSTPGMQPKAGAG